SLPTEPQRESLSMPSPFPGMDPYLEDEKLWPAFQHQLINCLYQILLPGLVDRYRARVAQRHYVTEQALFTSIVREEHHEDYVEIRQRSATRVSMRIGSITSISASAPTTACGPSSTWSARPTRPRRRAAAPTWRNAARP